MENNQMKKHEALRGKIRIFGFVALAAGLACSIVGLVNFFLTATRGEGFPRLFFLLFIGFPLIAVGVSALLFGFRGALMRYTKNESVPVFNEAGKEMAPGVRDLANAVREGAEKTADGVRCKCGTLNEQGSRFCRNCGAPLTEKCPVCGSEIPADSAFCNQCGAKIDK